MSIVTVREITAADQCEAAEVDRLATSDLRKVYRPNTMALQRRAVFGSLSRLVAVLDGQVVGTVQYHIDGDRLSFLGLSVHPNFRRRGVAAALAQHMERIARDSGCRCVTLYTVRETGNVTIFERMGFVVKSEEPSRLFESDRLSTLSEVFMEKDISQGEQT